MAANDPLQLAPPSTEYSIRFPDATPVTANAPSEVTRSVALVPVSFLSDTTGASMAAGRIVLVIATPASLVVIRSQRT